MRILTIALLLATGLPAAEPINAKQATRFSAEARAKIKSRASSEAAKREKQAWLGVIAMIASASVSGLNSTDAIVDDDLVDKFVAKLTSRGFTVATDPETGFVETVLHISWPVEDQK